MEAIILFIKRALPNLENDDVVNLTKHLLSDGLETEEDFNYLEYTHLKNHLQPIQAKMFVQFCENGTCIVYIYFILILSAAVKLRLYENTPISNDMRG